MGHKAGVWVGAPKESEFSLLLSGTLPLLLPPPPWGDVLRPFFVPILMTKAFPASRTANQDISAHFVLPTLRSSVTETQKTRTTCVHTLPIESTKKEQASGFGVVMWLRVTHTMASDWVSEQQL